MPAFENSQKWERTLQVGRETEEKTSKPHFMEWVKELPNPLPKGAKSRIKISKTKGTASNYLLWQGWSGFLVNMDVIDKDFGSGIPERTLIATIDDNEDVVKIELSFYHNYAGDLMKRLLDKNFDPSQTLRLSPYAIDKGAGKTGQNVGIAAFNGADTKLTANATEYEGKPAAAHLAGMPDLEKQTIKGVDVYDNTKRNEWLWTQLEAMVLPKLGVITAADRPVTKTVPHPDAVNFKGDASFPGAEDLPF